MASNKEKKKKIGGELSMGRGLDWNKGNRLSDETKNKISEKLKERWKTEAYRLNKFGTLELKGYQYRRIFPELTRSEIMKAIWARKGYKAKHKGHKETLDQIIKRSSKARAKLRPNKSEIRLDEILNTLFPNEYKYVGNGKFWVENMNPDFININGKKSVIEFFGNLFHKKEDEQKRIERLREYGFNALVVWQDEFKNMDELVKKLKIFHYEEGGNINVYD